MFTRCPNCRTVHALNASLIAYAGGRARCGTCKQKMNALAHLFDDWPASDTPAPASDRQAAPPLLGVEDESAETVTKTEPLPAGTVRIEKTGGLTRSTWVAMLAVLLLITTANLAWTFREPLLANPQFFSVLTRLGLVDPKAVTPYRDTRKLHLVSRDMHRHPARTGMLALSITFVNRAERAQPYPGIELILRDTANQPLARRVFSPAEYLPVSPAAAGDLAPNIHVPVLLEFADPGVTATGFEINFQ